ncbi:hypothetical protein ACXXDK_16595 (plasmid) [Deinococcus sp. PESE-38]
MTRALYCPLGTGPAQLVLSSRLRPGSDTSSGTGSVATSAPAASRTSTRPRTPTAALPVLLY